MADAAELRILAEKCRRLAALTHDSWTEEELLKLAEDYETEAARIDGGGKPGPPNPIPD